VQLWGEAPEQGFAAPLWLVQRDAQFLQLTEVLYRILEQATGQRTLDEIAAAVTASLGRPVSAANVRQLLATKLIPAGLVAPADGSGDAGAPRPRRTSARPWRSTSAAASSARPPSTAHGFSLTALRSFCYARARV
jgi:putative peptide zinc metalloprotease protein